MRVSDCGKSAKSAAGAQAAFLAILARKSNSVKHDGPGSGWRSAEGSLELLCLKAGGISPGADPKLYLIPAEPAEKGQLTIFASGPDEVRSRVGPLFDALGQRTIWVGAVGTGSRVKLVNNTWLAFATEGVAASVALARHLGLETQTVADVLGGGPLMSPWQLAKLQRIAKDDFSAQFALSLALKDVHLAL